MVSNNGHRLIVESLEDGKKLPVSATHKISALADIAIFTMEEDVPLSEVFDKMYEKTGGAAAPNHKSNPSELRDFISQILSDLDHDRVYDSDLKKLFFWFNILHEQGAFEAVASDPAPEEGEEQEAAND